jgi:hypothetical protein
MDTTEIELTQLTNQMQQKKLESFFVVKVDPNPLHKRVFIYDAANRRAFFATSPTENDDFVVTKLGVRLYRRNVVIGHNPCVEPFPVIATDFFHAIPLLKSNLQKAVRRKYADIAMSSALALIQQDRVQFIRRLAILFVEDVALFDSFPIVVWLMMADAEYVWSPRDIETLLHIVHTLATSDAVIRVDYDCDPPEKMSHEMFEHLPNGDVLLSMYYRMKYGGMKCDLRMLACALHTADLVVYPTVYADLAVPSKIEILTESVDFHPFPDMLGILERKTGICQADIKRLVWDVESGVNVRKKETVVRSVDGEQTEEWARISKYIDAVRMQIISR